jgi:methionine synthase II (cobalamin-independent)
MSQKLHSRPPFRAEHLGSLLRPQSLISARHTLIASPTAANQSALTALEDKEIDAIVKLQQSLGYKALTDGEYRRHMFWGSFFPGLDGFEEVSNPDIEMFRMYVPDIAAFTATGFKPGETVVCTGKIKHVGSTYIDQWNYLKNLVKPEEVGSLKLTLAAPEWYHLRYKKGYAYDQSVYKDDAEYFGDIARAYREELRILYEAGLRNVQIDDPNLAYFCDANMLAGFKSDGEDSDALLDAYIKLYNDCLSARPTDLHVGLHLCRGNFKNSVHFSEGSYSVIATKLFKDINVDTYYLEYDTPRAGGFEPLADVPKHKNVILGLVSSKFDDMEDEDELVERVKQAAKIMGGEVAMGRLGVSPQCGFASHNEGNSISREGMVEKLKLVRRIAERVWPREP